MRREKKWRFYCDHCKKSGASGGHIKKHERGCTSNPDRICGICEKVGEKQQPTPELLRVLQDEGLNALRTFAGHCPACMMAAVKALRKIEPLETDRETGDSNFIDFNYATEARSFWEDVNSREDCRF